MKTIIIAEAGVNHNGNLSLAKELIEAAANAGADFVKFQTFKADKLATRNAIRADYQKDNLCDRDNSQYNMLKKLELDEADHLALIKYCDINNIQFLSSGFDEESIDFLYNCGVKFFKIPSGEITNKPYLKHIARKKKPVIMSTGMAKMSEIKAALNVLTRNGLRIDQITILHCNSGYPTPMEDVNLKAMLTMQKELGVRIGYSDHTLGIEVSIAAVALGATIIEKHFTLDRNLPGPDHKASLEPDELGILVKAIRNIELAISGNGLKEPSESEKPNIISVRKSIHLNRKVEAGTMLDETHLVMKRPGNGISPMDVEKVIGKILKETLDEDTRLLWEHLTD